MRENDDGGDKERAPSIDGSRDRRTDTDQMRSLMELAVKIDEEEEEEEEGERRTFDAAPPGSVLPLPHQSYPQDRPPLTIAKPLDAIRQVVPEDQLVGRAYRVMGIASCTGKLPSTDPTIAE
ncbi:hypothetical protein BO83DRAFT_400593 [Aspergillus eucalypticola CBS 122712]|uniref:Uncharacterized protein n=1 Tax=Aspergillus eucalypticola (strain CBS 122712 / IBT 29274) TaxID=1448314 RepID=A0A317V5U9_ASPEC|nr:uncharacterized protein BO83DRAFT_400593 [Aspergillus eucalypticola CBS 122712]PWY68919.1 hypothetical protein BO83DRAFT_400593 [Aspergillus eucalypticola CBS 122712]